MSNWKIQLKEATTEEDFDKIKHLIVEDDSYLSEFITSPTVLRAYLRSRETVTVDVFYKYAKLYRVDMMEVILTYYTIQQVIEQRKIKFIIYIAELIREGAVDVITFLLDNGLDVNYTAFTHYCLLTQACSRGKVDIVDLLLSRGANVNLSDYSNKRTPAFYAVESGDIRILDRLIMHGADLNHCGRNKTTIWESLFPYTTEKTVVFYQRLADMRVPTGEGLLSKFLESKQRNISNALAKRIIVIMRSAGAEEPTDRWRKAYNQLMTQ